MRTSKTLVLLAGILLAVTAPRSHAKPLKVYILAGQSNMQGQARLYTIDRLAMTPDSADMYEKMTGGGGKYETTEVEGDPYKGKKFTIVPETYISSQISNDKSIEGKGPLTVGFGSAKDKIGPEYTFGLYMHEYLQEPILIIKTAWGGRDLVRQFRPPSAGPYYTAEQAEERAKFLTEKNKQKGRKEVVTAEALKAETGQDYRNMMAHVKKVLADIDNYHPAYKKKDGYEIAGFVWFQGWNDLVNGNDYPDNPTHPQTKYALYSKLMTTFIHDVRKDLNAPRMPFVIGVIGVGGELEPDNKQQYLRRAMAAPASLEEFKGTVKAVYTHRFWDTKAQALLDKVEEAANKRVDEKYPEYKNKPRAREGAVAKMRKTVKPEVLTKEELAFLNTATSNGGYHYNGSAYTYGRAARPLPMRWRRCPGSRLEGELKESQPNREEEMQ